MTLLNVRHVLAVLVSKYWRNALSRKFLYGQKKLLAMQTKQYPSSLMSSFRLWFSSGEPTALPLSHNEHSHEVGINLPLYFNTFSISPSKMKGSMKSKYSASVKYMWVNQARLFTKWHICTRMHFWTKKYIIRHMWFMIFQTVIFRILEHVYITPTPLTFLFTFGVKRCVWMNSGQ